MMRCKSSYGVLILWLVAIFAFCQPATSDELKPPKPLKSEDQVLSADLYVQFQDITLNTLGKIWTRAYGITPPTDINEESIIPGPTFYIQPGDLFHVDLHNELSEKLHPKVKEYESLIPVTLSGSSKDDVAKNIVHHEVNIPHNPNNTNLHVHGLHVAPSRDDVTIVVVPTGTSKEEAEKYSQPSKFLGDLTEESVSDRPVQIGQWNYFYRIPDFHLPGTHWYHSHKHGSTALQTENGMAGTIVMGQWSELDPLAKYNKQGKIEDRVMIMQGLLNYGLNFGAGKRDNLQEQKLNLTLNGQLTENKAGKPILNLTVAPNQLERWRLVNATANHANISYLWLGGTNDNGKTYKSVPIYMLAVDGITMSKLVKVTADSPMMMAPGNRVDVLARLDGKYKQYSLIRNVPANTETIDGKDVAKFSTLKSGPLANPYMFDLSGETKAKDTVSFKDARPDAKEGQTIEKLLVPLIRTKKIAGTDGSDLLDVVIIDDEINKRVPLEPKADDIGWQMRPGGAGGLSPGQVVLQVHVDPGKKATNTTNPVDINPAQYSPGLLGTLDRPAYASLVENPEILQSRAAVFDVSNVVVFAQGSVEESGKKKGVEGRGKKKGVEESGKKKGKKQPPKPVFNKIRQLTINGRVFALNDSIGDPDANELVGRSAGKHLADFVKDIDPVINFETTDDMEGPVQDSLVNPSYYRKLVEIGPNKYQYQEGQVIEEVTTGIPKFNLKTGEPINPPEFLKYTTYEDPPTLEDITGIAKNHVSIVNSKFSRSRPANVPGLPVATTAEEWILINNSDVGHPFHIHINPFFVTEVGQLTHNDEQGWHLLKNTLDGTSPGSGASSPFGWVVGEWWDTILIPPHGYVKFRYWINVPEQVEDEGPVKDNQNIEGIWVYHCHILRHEDRGMMMVVETQANKSPEQARIDALKAREAERRGIKPPGGD